MDEAEAKDLWNRLTTQERDEIAFHALQERFFRDTDLGNQEAVRRGTVGAGVLHESASHAARARQELSDSIDRALKRAREQRDAPEDVRADGVTSNLEENAQRGGERSGLQTSANDGGATDPTHE